MIENRIVGQLVDLYDGCAQCELIIDYEKRVFQTREFYQEYITCFKNMKVGDLFELKIEYGENKVSLEVIPIHQSDEWDNIRNENEENWKKLDVIMKEIDLNKRKFEI